jgi:hypothetical protein
MRHIVTFICWIKTIYYEASQFWITFSMKDSINKIDVKDLIDKQKAFIKASYNKSEQQQKASQALDHASNLARLRSSVPPRMQRRLLFRISKKLNKAFIKCHQLMFFDQKKINDALISSQKHSLSAISELSETVQTLSKENSRLKAMIETLKDKQKS